MASLEAFQEAIDQVYQDALNIPRRRSDDAVSDDVCEFFDEFGFDEITYAGDVLAVDEIKLDEVKEELEGGPEPEASSAEQDASPVEKLLAQEIINVMAKPAPVPKPPIPPVENEATLRAKGIARLANMKAQNQKKLANHHARKDSLTITKTDPESLPLLPPPDHSMLEAVLEPSGNESNAPVLDMVPNQSEFDWGDDVEELDGHTFWLGPGVFQRKKGVKSRQRKEPSTTPMERMRDLAFL